MENNDGEWLNKPYHLVTKNAGQEFFYEDEHFVLRHKGKEDQEAIFHFLDKDFGEQVLNLLNAAQGIDDLGEFLKGVKNLLEDVKEDYDNFTCDDPMDTAEVLKRRIKNRLALFPNNQDKN